MEGEFVPTEYTDHTEKKRDLRKILRVLCILWAKNPAASF